MQTTPPATIWQDDVRQEVLKRVHEASTFVQAVRDQANQVAGGHAKVAKVKIPHPLGARPWWIYDELVAPPPPHLLPPAAPGLVQLPMMGPGAAPPGAVAPGAAAPGAAAPDAPHRARVTLEGLLRVLATVKSAVTANMPVTLRSVYYSHKDVFRTQDCSNKAICMISNLLEVRRPFLGIFASSRGLLWAPGLTIHTRAEAAIACDTVAAPHGFRISDAVIFDPGFKMSIDPARPPAFLLVVEKESAFQRIVQEQMARISSGQPHTRFILLTGSGMPSLACRVLVKKLASFFTACHAPAAAAVATATDPFPVLGMVDLNPPGLSILLTYVYCSSRSLGNSVGFLDSRDDYTTPNIRWIGVTNAMAEAEAAFRGVSVAALAAGTYTTRDDSRLRNLREHPRIRDNVRMLAEIAKMETLACKVEIDQMTHMSSLVALIDRAFKNKTWIEC